MEAQPVTYPCIRVVRIDRAMLIVVVKRVLRLPNQTRGGVFLQREILQLGSGREAIGSVRALARGVVVAHEGGGECGRREGEEDGREMHGSGG